MQVGETKNNHIYLNPILGGDGGWFRPPPHDFFNRNLLKDSKNSKDSKDSKYDKIK